MFIAETGVSGLTPAESTILTQTSTKVDDVQVSIDNLPTPDEMSEAELHTGLDSYVNKDDYKADISNLSADVNVIEVAWNTVTDINDFKATGFATEIKQDVMQDDVKNAEDWARKAGSQRFN